MMTIDDATTLVRHTLMLTLLISSPLLILGLLVGLVISVFQAVTQIQEQTLTFIPKIVAMVVGAIVLLPWIGQQLMEYTKWILSSGLN